MIKWITKVSSADNGTKAKVIKANSHKYSIVKMCKKLQISRSLYYYHINLTKQEPKEEYEETVISAFKENRSVCGAKKIRNELRKQRIRKTMEKMV